MKVVLADDHRLILDGDQARARERRGVRGRRRGENGSRCCRWSRGRQPDLVLLDMRMPGMDGLACLDQIQQRYPEIKVVMLSAFTDPKHIEASLKRGASAYIVKSVEPGDLPSALRQAVEGTSSRAVGAAGGARRGAAKAAGLTEREIAILESARRGLSNDADRARSSGSPSRR